MNDEYDEALAALVMEIEALEQSTVMKSEVASLSKCEASRHQQKAKKSTWKSHHSRVSALVREIDVLQRELRAHRADRLLRESLDRLLDIQRDRDWRKVASHEERARETSTAANARLRARVADYLKLGKRVRKLLKQQLSTVSACKQATLGPSKCIYFVDSDDARVYSFLEANLDTQCHRINAILESQWVTPIITPAVRKAQLHPDGCGVTFRDFKVIPFSVETATNGVLAFSQKFAIMGCMDGRSVFTKKRVQVVEDIDLDGDKTACDETMPGWSLLRLIVSPDRTVMIWQALMDWSTTDGQRTAVHETAWAVIDPLRDDSSSVDQNASHLQSGISVRIRSKSDLNEQESDCLTQVHPLLNTIVRTLDQFYVEQHTVAENLLLDESLQRKKTCCS